MARRKRKGVELALFKGRKADLTHAILRTLSNETLVKYDVHKVIVKQGFRDTRYGSVKKRIKALEETGYLRVVGVRKTRPGGEGILYEATFKALSAIKLSTINIDGLFEHIDEDSAVEFLALITRLQFNQLIASDLE